MKRFFLVLTLQLVAFSAAHAQWQAYCADTLITNCQPNSTCDFTCTIQNLSCCSSINCTQEIDITNLPPGWGVTMCNPNGCIPYGVKSNTMTLAPNQRVTAKFTVHIGSNLGVGTFVGRFKVGSKTIAFKLTADASQVSAVSDVESDRFLSQNFPNPFYGATNVRYSLDEPGGTIVVTDLMGRIVGQYPILDAEGQVTIGQYLSDGVYQYALYQKGKLKARRKMIIQQ